MTTPPPFTVGEHLWLAKPLGDGFFEYASVTYVGTSSRPGYVQITNGRTGYDVRASELYRSEAESRVPAAQSAFDRAKDALARAQHAFATARHKLTQATCQANAVRSVRELGASPPIAAHRRTSTGVGAIAVAVREALVHPEGFAAGVAADRAGRLHGWLAHDCRRSFTLAGYCLSLDGMDRHRSEFYVVKDGELCEGWPDGFQEAIAAIDKATQGEGGPLRTWALEDEIAHEERLRRQRRALEQDERKRP